MHKRIGIVMLVLLFGCCLVLAEDVDSSTDIANLSAERTLGIGMQLDFPFGGLLSGRYWFTPEFAGETILFLWGYAGEVEGTLTARALYRIADRPVVDFYGAVGATMPVSPYGWEPVVLSTAGGIEFGFRFAPSLAWNIEFGIAYSTDGELSMVFGTGIHFYF